MKRLALGARIVARTAFVGSAFALGVTLSRAASDSPWQARTQSASPVTARHRDEARASLAATAHQPSVTPLLLPPASQTSVPGLGEETEQPRDGLGEAFKDGQVMTGATPHRLILFTFDDGPYRETTPKLLDRLDAAGVRAVFFLTASNLRGDNAAQRKNQDIARDAVRRGHIVASHGMYHRQLPLLSDYDVLLELGQAEAIFKRVFGGRPWLIRPPGGARSNRTDRLLAERQYTTVLWNLGAGDFQVRTAEDVHKTWAAVFARRQTHGEQGGIILLHDTYAWSVEAFQLIFNDLLERNCQLLAAHEELYDIVNDPTLFFRARSGSPSAEVAPIVLDPYELESRQAPLREETSQRCQPLATR